MVSVMEGGSSTMGSGASSGAGVATGIDWIGGDVTGLDVGMSTADAY